MTKSFSILGSTGSIGLASLDIISKTKNSKNINILSANKNYRLICKQILKFKPKFFIINDKLTYDKVKKKFKKKKIKILNSFESINLKKKSNITVSAIPGIQGLEPTLKLIKLSKKILIANKESVICGWSLIKKKAKENQTKVIPVDSEHFSIFKLLKGKNLTTVKKVYITASGGPFLNLKLKNFKKIDPQDALKHPKWKMGKKITVDSSTLMNKILEIIEANKLFNISLNKLDILIHPNSLVHAIVEYNNGISEFIYHETSMLIPLANALLGDEININDYLKSKNNDKYFFKNLSFLPVNKKIFPVINLKNRINEYPSTPIIINAANEILVDLFLQKKIPFLSISKTIMKILNVSNYKKYAIRIPKNIKDIYKIDSWTRKEVLKKLKVND